MALILFSQDVLVECGTDEAGRGCLAGPVTAAAVILPAGFDNNLITDSKLLTHEEREELRPLIEKAAIAWSIAHVTPKEIDKINILNASIKAMHLAIAKLHTKPQHLIVDGNRFKLYPGCTHECVVQGDSKYLSIAAASILAKTERDRYMTALHLKCPHYKWNTNKGYGTVEHRKAIMKYGLTPHHRRSFRQLPLEATEQKQTRSKKS